MWNWVICNYYKYMIGFHYEYNQLEYYEDFEKLINEEYYNK